MTNYIKFALNLLFSFYPSLIKDIFVHVKGLKNPEV
jgi:hypothetical protein